MTPKPTSKPQRPQFSSGPTVKRPGWSAAALAEACLGRSHRSKQGKAKLAEALDLSRAILGLPQDYRIGIVPGSDTGAVEMALWSLLGARGVDVLAWEAFGKGWVSDIAQQLKLADLRKLEAPYGRLPDLGAVDFSRDVVFAWNGTTSGVRVPNGDWIPEAHDGLVICDATSAVFAMELPWAKLDVVTWSWQKVLGGEGGHGLIVLSPRAVARLESYQPAWPLPKIFQLTAKGKLNEGIFRGETINTPSLLVVEDAIDALRWAEGIGGLPALIARTEANAAVIARWVEASPWAGFLAETPAKPLAHLDLPEDHRSRLSRPRRRGPGRLRQSHCRSPRGRGGGLRHRRLSRRAAGPAHLGRGHGGERGSRGPAPLARLGLRRNPPRLTPDALSMRTPSCFAF